MSRILTCSSSLYLALVEPGAGRSSNSSSVSTITPNTAKNMMKMKKLIFARSLAREGAARARHRMLLALYSRSSARTANGRQRVTSDWDNDDRWDTKVHGARCLGHYARGDTALPHGHTGLTHSRVTVPRWYSGVASYIIILWKLLLFWLAFTNLSQDFC